jgi:uncharacterized small protein (DUF1192 family)
MLVHAKLVEWMTQDIELPGWLCRAFLHTLQNSKQQTSEIVHMLTVDEIDAKISRLSKEILLLRRQRNALVAVPCRLPAELITRIFKLVHLGSYRPFEMRCDMHFSFLFFFCSFALRFRSAKTVSPSATVLGPH